MGMRTWLTNLGEAAQVRLLNIQLDKLYKTLGLTGDNSSKNDNVITFPITIDKGGTGAITAEEARDNLGAASVDHTHDTFDSEVNFNAAPGFNAGIGDFGASIQVGAVYDVNVSASSYLDGTVTFSAPFKSAPIVILQPMAYSTTGNMGKIIISTIGLPTATGFRWRIQNGHTSALRPSFRWMAIGAI